MSVMSMEPIIGRALFVVITYPLCVALGWYIVKFLRVLFRGRGG